MATARDPKETIPFNRPVNGKLIKAKLKYWAWTLGIKVPFSLMYAGVIAEGFRQISPSFAQKVYKIPFLGFLKRYELFYQVDVAPFFALALILAVFWASARLIKFWLSLGPGYCMTQDDWLGLLVGIVLLTLDSYLFLRGILSLNWNGEFSFNCLLATAAYMSVVTYVSYISVKLHSDVKELED